MYFLFTFIVLFILVAVIWRFASRHHTIPCPTWLSWLVEMDNPFSKISRAAVIIEHLDLKPGMAVLDLGCGPGRVTIPLAQRVGPQGKVVAVDIQPGMLTRAKAKAQIANISNIDFVQAAAGDNKLGLELFDRAVLVSVLGEIPDRVAALKEIFAALKPGGILSVTEIIFDPHFQRRKTVLRLAIEAGFREKAYFGSCLAYTLHLEKFL